MRVKHPIPMYKNRIQICTLWESVLSEFHDESCSYNTNKITGNTKCQLVNVGICRSWEITLQPRGQRLVQARIINGC